MQVAAILSDLKSLAACPPEAATKLVTVHKTISEAQSADREGNVTTTTQQPSTSTSIQPDPDLERASTLISLHESVKVKYEESGLDEDLLQAREDVRRILGSLGTMQ